MRDHQARRTARTFQAAPWVLFPVALLAAPGKLALRRPEPPVAAQEAALLALHPGLSPQAAKQRLKRMVEAWDRVQRGGWMREAAWREGLEEGRAALLSRAFLDQMPGHPGMSEQELQKSFLAQGEQRRVSHVLCPTEEAAGVALARLKQGESFETVAPELSKDPSAKTNHGLLGWIRQREMVPEFGGPVFLARPGELVGPMKSQYGWHVAKVWETRMPTLEDFMAQRATLLKQAEEAQLSMKREKALEPLRRQYPLKADLAVLGADRTTEILPGDEAKVAGRVAGKAISLKALKGHLYRELKTMGQSHSLGASTKARFMEGLADSHRLAAAALKRGLDRRPEVAASLHVDQLERAYAEFSRRHLASVAVPEAELKAFHAAHPEQFRSVGALRLQVMVAETRDRIDEALNRVLLGLPWREAAAKFANPESTGDPEPGWVEVDALRRMVPPSLLAPLMGGSLNQPVGPMLGPDGFMIFNVLERRPGPVLEFQACQEAVQRAYLQAEGARLVDEALETAGKP